MSRAFATTRWSLVLSAGSDGERARPALTELCRLYWRPVYTFMRAKRAGNHEAARDLTQEFFARLLERNDLALADRTRGRFRDWLLAAARHFLANEWDFQTAQKRDARSLSFLDEAELADVSLCAIDTDTPEQAYQRAWAHTLLERAMARLADSYAASNKHGTFSEVKHLLLGPAGEAPDYSPHAERLGVRADTLKVQVHRMRAEFGATLRSELSELVESPEEVTTELTYLLSVLSKPRGA